MLRVNDASSPLLRAATEADEAQIHSLLASSGLPTSDLKTSRPEFLVACEGARIIGVGGVERFGTTGLLRSVAVSDQHRGRGVGAVIVAALERHARDGGLHELVLLTQTAAPFFEHHGYRAIERNSAPASVQASAEFRTLCPDSARCMLKGIRDP